MREEELARTSTWDIGKASDWEVSSAGLQAAPMQPVLPNVLQAASQLGIDLSVHWSQHVANLDLGSYDLIIVMQKSHQAELLELHPELQERVYLFSQVVDHASYDIPDVYHSSQGVMSVCAGMNDLIRRRLTYICVLAIALHNKQLSA